MSTIRAQCPQCGTVALVPLTALTITVAPRPGGLGRCVFVCRACGGEGWWPVDQRQAEVLRRQGTRLSPRAQAQQDHPARWAWREARRPQGPPLTHDDLLDLHLLLQRDDWFDQLLASTR